MQTIKPAAKQLFCKPVDAATKTQSGILLPDKSVEKPLIGEVINVGDKVSGYKDHDQIIYKSYTTTDIRLNGQDFFLVDVEDVLGTVAEVKE